MDDKKKKDILYALIALAILILIGVGSTFAYFTATISSEENAVNLGAAEFKLELTEDTDLIKGNLIPSEEKYVDMAIARVDETGAFKKPYKDETTGETITAGTACIDDNLNEICSIYTFTISNPMTTNAIPLYVTLKQSMNTFENLYYKVLDSEGNVVIPATRIIDDRYLTNPDGSFQKDATGKRIPKENFDSLTISPAVLTGINKTLPAAPNETTKSSVTYSIVMWIMETHTVQNESDGGKLFASTLYVSASGAEGGGITGIMSTSGVENS